MTVTTTLHIATERSADSETLTRNECCRTFLRLRFSVLTSNVRVALTPIVHVGSCLALGSDGYRRSFLDRGRLRPAEFVQAWHDGMGEETF